MAETLAAWLGDHGVENFHGPGLTLPAHAVFEPPCSIKWMGIIHSIEMGAFSYAVSGHYAKVRIGRYCSFGEQIQMGRGDHPTTWISTSPIFYEQKPMFRMGGMFDHAADYHGYTAPTGMATGVRSLPIEIGHDVWIGHAAYVKPGVRIGTGAIVAAHSVVTKDVPPYAIVAGNPARIKKYRVPEELIVPLLASQWWQYAPWDLKGLSLDDPKAFLDQLAERRPRMTPYAPSLTRAADFRPPAGPDSGPSA